jgi:hypothetical protein
MKILCDYHHGELYESILKLFEDRLGFAVYRPVGIEWHDEGYWTIGHHADVIHQYLTKDFSTETQQAGIWQEDGGSNGEYFRNVIDIFERAPHKTITLEAAKEMKWDIILTTMENHFPLMEEFRRKFCPSAKHVFQIGNYLDALPRGVVNAMNSTASPCNDVPNVVDYYQEFNTAMLPWQLPANAGKTVYTFLILNAGHRGSDFMALEAAMPNWVFKEYGSHNRDGNIHKYKTQCEKICEAAFIWHVKLNGDGYGYNLHRALYAGKPMILNYSTVFSHHRLARFNIFREGETIINYDGKTIEELKAAVLRMHENWEGNSHAIRQRMQELVNFDNEETKVRKFLERLQ